MAYIPCITSASLCPSQPEASSYHSVRICLPISAGLATTILKGSFPASLWTTSLRFAYSLSKKELFALVSMRLGDRFQLIQRGTVFLHPDFEVDMVSARQDDERGIVNVFMEKRKRKINVGTAHKGKTERHYEDGHFVTGNFLGVADGVSAWSNRGIDAGVFARELMSHCQNLLENRTAGSLGLQRDEEHDDMRKVLEGAMHRTQSFGSCTALLAHVKRRSLEILSLGDSQVAVIRLVEGSPRLVFKTKPQTHSWSTPFQLANIPPHLKHSFIEDSVRDSVSYSVDIEPGDWVVMGTDGVWDNLFDHEIANIIGEGNYSSPTEIAEAITRRAYEKSISTEATPFSESFSGDEEGWAFLGGKPDDITVVVAQV